MHSTAHQAEDYLQIVKSLGSNREITCPDFKIKFLAPHYWLPLLLQQMNAEIKSKLWHLDQEKLPYPTPIKWHELVERQRLTENLTIDHKREIFLTTQEAAKHLHCSVNSIKNWVDNGELKCKKTPGGHRRIPMSVLTSFANRNKSNQKLMLENEAALTPQGDPYTAKDYPIFIIPYERYQMVVAIEPEFRGLPEPGKNRFQELSRLIQSAENAIQGALNQFKIMGKEQPAPAVLELISDKSDNEQFLRTNAAAKLLGISESSLRRNRSIPHSITPGGHRAFDLKALKSALKDM